ncbi:MAG: 3-methyladenine DNA glycosylase [Thalassobium sp.]|nr:MAG: 3-methyladenine DNA glycosylase [Thalassobium sp.]
MLSFSRFIEQAQAQHTDYDLRFKHISKAKSAKQLAAIPDDRWLSVLSQCVFQSGFNWTVVANKWPRFEEVFLGFDVIDLVMQPDEFYERLMQETGIIRHHAKIKAVHENAIFFHDLIQSHGSVGQYFSAWKPEDYADNLREFRKRSNRGGGRTGQVFLRAMGVDTLMFSNDMLQALISTGVIEAAPSSKASWAKLQATMDRWREETGLGLSEISQILAWSVGPRK